MIFCSCFLDMLLWYNHKIYLLYTMHYEWFNLSWTIEPQCIMHDALYVICYKYYIIQLEGGDKNKFFEFFLALDEQLLYAKTMQENIFSSSFFLFFAPPQIFHPIYYTLSNMNWSLSTLYPIHYGFKTHLNYLCSFWACR